jgi:hypothetical protein
MATNFHSTALQSMKVPRLRAMCEARGLKKNGTKQQLINRLLASTADRRVVK